MVPFVIVADVRTGSTLLSTSLDAHPEIRCYGELFHGLDLPDNQLDSICRHDLAAGQLIAAAFSAEARAVGFRAMLFLPPATHPQWAGVWEHLGGWPDLRVIWLARRDRLSQYASMLVAQQTAVYHPYDNDPLLRPENRPTITVDPEAFRQWVRQRDRLSAVRRRQLAARPGLELDYEALTGDWADSIGQVQQFLGVAPLPLTQGKRKQETRPLAEVIENYHELEF